MKAWWTALWVEKDGNRIAADVISLRHKLGIRVFYAETFDVGFDMFVNIGFDLILMEPCFPGPQGKRYSLEKIKEEEVGINFVQDVRKISLDIPIVLASSLVWMGGGISNDKEKELRQEYEKQNCKFLERPYTLEEFEKIVKESVRR